MKDSPAIQNSLQRFSALERVPHSLCLWGRGAFCLLWGARGLRREVQTPEAPIPSLPAWQPAASSGIYGNRNNPQATSSDSSSMSYQLIWRQSRRESWLPAARCGVPWITVLCLRRT